MSTAGEYLRRLGATINVSAGKPDRDDDGWQHDRYRVRLNYQGRQMTLQFRKGLGHAGSPPTLDEVADSIRLDCSTALDLGFEDWAAELGYDADSRKAEDIYRQCVIEANALRRLLGDETRFAEFLDTEGL